jgi:hypothetical protein
MRQACAGGGGGGRGKKRLGVGRCVGVEAAAEGCVFDFQFVVALFEFLDRGDHRRDAGRVFVRQGFVRAAVFFRRRPCLELWLGRAS